MKNKLVYIIGGSIVAGSLMLGGPAFAAERSRAKPAIFGSVVAVSKEDITVTGKSGKQGTTTTYTVDLTKAKITKGLGQGASAVSVANLEVGDKVAVLGTITGDAVEASAVFDKGSAAKSKTKNKHR